jgi:hypothetical protein
LENGLDAACGAGVGAFLDYNVVRVMDTAAGQ